MSMRSPRDLSRAEGADTEGVGERGAGTGCTAVGTPALCLLESIASKTKAPARVIPMCPNTSICVVLGTMIYDHKRLRNILAICDPPGGDHGHVTSGRLRKVRFIGTIPSIESVDDANLPRSNSST